ncbi:hypothetical protein TKK_0011313 [Trichogramma kaykai]
MSILPNPLTMKKTVSKHFPNLSPEVSLEKVKNVKAKESSGSNDATGDRRRSTTRNVDYRERSSRSPVLENGARVIRKKSKKDKNKKRGRPAKSRNFSIPVIKVEKKEDDFIDVVGLEPRERHDDNRKKRVGRPPRKLPLDNKTVKVEDLLSKLKTRDYGKMKKRGRGRPKRLFNSLPFVKTEMNDLKLKSSYVKLTKLVVPDKTDKGPQQSEASVDAQPELPSDGDSAVVKPDNPENNPDCNIYEIANGANVEEVKSSDEADPIAIDDTTVWLQEDSSSSAAGGALNFTSYLCKNCSAGFRRVADLYRHKCGPIPPRYACPYCEKRDHYSSNINRHVKRWHPNMPIKFSKIF